MVRSADNRAFVRETREAEMVLRGGVSFLALCAFAMATPAFAQQAGTEGAPSEVGSGNPDTDDVSANEASGDEIVITGYRQSLSSAQDIKRNSDVIVDSVTAEDIGALPDRSVTETLQRIPGVAINRFAAGVDPDHFSVEGSGVVVRGLTYVRSEFNGREAFTANNGRALGFADVPSELLGGVDVFKSPSADRIEGGIAGVVNLRTRKPFDAAGFVAAGSLEMNYGDFIDKSSPTISVLASNRWDTPVGEFGVLGSFVYSQLFSRADRFQLSSFRARNLYSDGDVTDNGNGSTIVGEVLFPRGAVVSSQEFDRERYGYSAAGQWRSNDGSMEAVFQFLRSDARQAWTERTVEIATDNVSANGDSRRVPGTELEFDDNGLFQSGVITGPTGWRDDQNSGSARTPAFGLQSNNIARGHESQSITEDYGFNFRWDVNDRFGLNFDYQHVVSTVDVLDATLWNSTYQNASINLNGSDMPDVAFLPPIPCFIPATVNGAANVAVPCSGEPGSANNPTYYGEGHASYADPYNSFPRAAMDHIEQSEGNSDAFRIDGELAFPDSGFLTAIRAGVRYADRAQTARFSTYNWGRLSEQWGNGGPVWLDDNVDGVPGGTGGSPNAAWEPFYYADFMRNQINNPLMGEPRLFYSGNPARDYEDYVQYANSIINEWVAPTTCALDGRTINDGFNQLSERCGVVPGTSFLPGEINPIREQNYAAYLMARFDTDFANGWNLSGNVGLRYSKTKRDSEGYRSFPVNTSFPSEQECSDQIAEIIELGAGTVSGFCSVSAAQRASVRNYLNGALEENNVNIDYDYFLPSMNLKLEVGGGLQFRAAYFKGIAPPETGLIRNYFPISIAAVQNFDDEGNPIIPEINPDGTVTPGAFTLQGQFNTGNPFLLPVEADNFDVTAEWYFSDVGQLAVSAFYKRLKNVLTNDTARYTFENNGESFESIVSTPMNSDEIGTIKGFELSYQQTYDFLPGILSGLGMQANYTFVDSKGVPQSTLSATDPDVGAGRVSNIDLAQLPLQGLSKHTFNVTPFLDYGKLSLRASYSWRSDFLVTIRDVIVPYDPIVQKSGGQLDASIFYSVSDNFKLGVQGVNLMNQTIRTVAVVQDIDGSNTEVPRGWYMNDRRFTAVARFNF